MRTLKRNTSLFPEFDSLVNSVLNGGFYVRPTEISNGNINQPAVNISENNDQYSIELAAPGFAKDSFAIKVENHVLTISGTLKEKSKENSNEYLKREFTTSSFERNFTLPKNKADENKINAVYDNGILKVAIAKKEEAKPLPAREIAIN